MYWEDFIADMCHAMFGFEKPRWHYIPEFGALLDAIGDRQNHAQANRPRLDQRVPESGLTSRLSYAFELCLGRKPTAREKDRLATYFDQQQDWIGISRVLLNLDEFI